MTMTLSIEAVGSQKPDIGLAATQPPCRPQGVASENPDGLQGSGRTPASVCRPLSGLEELVADNEALGRALQSLVDALDGSPSVVVDAPVVVKKAAVGTLVGAKPEDAVVENLLPEARPVKVAVVEKTVVAVAEPSVVTASVVASTGEVAVGMKPAGADVRTETSEKPTAAVDASVVSMAPKTEERSEDGTVVLQAAPMVSAPVADGVAAAPVAVAESVAAVASVSPLDLNDMFLAAAEAVAAAVTVSPELMRGEAGEIRVQLRPDVLEGSEVIVAVDDRKMEVTFVPAATHVADAILANQPILQRQLVERIAGFEVSVGVIQAVATNVASSVGSAASVRTALNDMRRSNGRS